MNAILLSAMLYTAAADLPAPVAMVLTTQGSVTLERGKAAPQRIGPRQLLRPGDRLNVPADGSLLLVMLADGRRERLRPKTQATVGEKGCAPPEAVERVEAAALSSGNLSNLREHAHSERGGVLVLRSAGLSPLQRALPLYQATVLTGRPTLSWPAPQGLKVESYRVELRDGNDKEVLGKATTREPRLVYPDKQKPLENGTTVCWHVTAILEKDKREEIVNSAFSIATREQIEQLASLQKLTASPEAADWLLAAVTYEACDVQDEALRLYEKLTERVPKEANYFVILADYYRRSGQRAKAEAALAQAKKLGYVPAKP